jgi:hypothetical protein
MVKWCPVGVSVLCTMTDPAYQSYGQPYNAHAPSMLSHLHPFPSQPTPMHVLTLTHSHATSHLFPTHTSAGTCACACYHTHPQLHWACNLTSMLLLTWWKITVRTRLTLYGHSLSFCTASFASFLSPSMEKEGVVGSKMVTVAENMFQIPLLCSAMYQGAVSTGEWR